MLTKFKPPWKELRFIAKMGGLIVCYQNKYTINSNDCECLMEARNTQQIKLKKSVY